LFAVIGFPQRDYAARAASPSPNGDDHASVEKSDRDETILAVIAPVV
jgi:hypothetical protein